MQHQIILFYKYVHIDNPQEVKLWHDETCFRLDLTGRCIIAHEGINATFEGTNEIIGVHLKPEELHKWIKNKKEFYVVDMRNVYEHKVGHFENSILPPIENFRDLPKVVEQIKHLKNKTVLTVCTGGVRCEKASGFLITQGFNYVYQLDGGIVSYMEKYPNEDFNGKLYVFDKRVTMGFYTDDPKHKIIGKCDICGGKSENYVNCANPVCHRHFINCVNCLSKSNGKAFCRGGCVLSRHGRKISPVETNLVE